MDHHFGVCTEVVVEFKIDLSEGISLMGLRDSGYPVHCWKGSWDFNALHLRGFNGD